MRTALIALKASVPFAALVFTGGDGGLGEDGDALVPFFVGTDGPKKSSGCSDRASETGTAGMRDCAFFR